MWFKTQPFTYKMALNQMTNLVFCKCRQMPSTFAIKGPTTQSHSDTAENILTILLHFSCFHYHHREAAWSSGKCVGFEIQRSWVQFFFNIFICILGLRHCAVQAASNDRFQGHWRKSQAGLLAISLKSSQKPLNKHADRVISINTMCQSFNILCSR